MRVCLVYDHVFPATVGGGERWFRDLSARLAEAGHEVTYLTMRHWDGAPPEIPGVRLLGLVPAGRVYADERRTLLPPLRFGLAVARHLWRHGRGYDVVHTAAFPYFPLLAAGLLRRRARYTLVVDWFEVWTREYWQRYAGTLAGTAGWLVQRACVRLRHRAHALSQLHARRLSEEGYSGTPVVLSGLYEGPPRAATDAAVDPDLVVYAGRHVREKRLDLLLRAFAAARARRPTLRLRLVGDGPDRERIARLACELRLDGAVELPGRLSEEGVAAAIATAACVATASEREGYGLLVVEAAARGTPTVLVDGTENAAVELVDGGVNGMVAPTATADALADAILHVIGSGGALRASTAAWFDANAPRLRLDASLDVILSGYAGRDEA